MMENYKQPVRMLKCSVHRCKISHDTFIIQKIYVLVLLIVAISGFFYLTLMQI